LVVAHRIVSAPIGVVGYGYGDRLARGAPILERRNVTNRKTCGTYPTGDTKLSSNSSRIPTLVAALLYSHERTHEAKIMKEAVLYNPLEGGKGSNAICNHGAYFSFQRGLWRQGNREEALTLVFGRAFSDVDPIEKKPILPLSGSTSLSFAAVVQLSGSMPKSRDSSASARPN